MFNVTRKKSDSAVQQPQQQQQQQQHHNYHHNSQQQSQLLQQQQHQSSNCNLIKEKPKFVRRVSIARLFGNAYSTHQHMSRQKNDATSTVKARILFKNRNHTTTNVANNNNKLKIERFKNRSESQIDHMGTDCTDFCKSDKLPIEDFCDEKDLSARAIRTISKGLGLIWRRSYSVEISTPDPEYKVFYLGNVLTGWAKGDNCIEKPLATLWRNYTQINKPDVAMRVLVCSSGLKATTRQHGLTEYWANRITYCCSPKNYPRVFCWIYRHEGRKLKHELRCHAVLCPKESIAEEICKTLKENLSQALKEFKRDKISRQNARLSLVNSLYENPSMPRRKILLSVGANNYRPPMERSKSAPKLMAIEEAVGEEDEICSTPSFRKSQGHSPYCNSNLFAAATFDRKYCKRNKMSGRDSRFNSQTEYSKSRCTELASSKSGSLINNGCSNGSNENNAAATSTNGSKSNAMLMQQSPLSLYDDDDEFNHLLMTNDYDMKSSLSGEILSYFDTKLSESSDIDQSVEIDLHPNGSRCSETIAGPDTSGVGDPHEIQHAIDNGQFEYDSFNSTIDDFCSLETPNTVYNQNDILNGLVEMSVCPKKRLSYTGIASDKSDMMSQHSATATQTVDNCVKNSILLSNELNFTHTNGASHIVPFLMDSDEGSITSGCETSSIITTAHMDELMKSEREIDAITLSLSRLPSSKHPATNLARVCESDHSNQHNHSDRRHHNDDDDDDDDEDEHNDNVNSNVRNNKHLMNTNTNINNNNNNSVDHSNEDDSEFSDESGFDENNLGKANHFRNNLCNESAESTSNADANNNIKHTFSPNATKTVGRLRINIPKNAKSIDI